MCFRLAFIISDSLICLFSLLDAVNSGTDTTDTLPREGKIKPKGGAKDNLPQHRELLNSVHKTFANIVGSTALLKPLLPPES